MLLAHYLKLNKFEEWKPSQFGEKIVHKLRFAMISGRVPPKERPLIVQTFNQGSNMYGDIIATLLVSETGAEGLDLKNIREVHILEPYWDMARIIQIQGRAIRKGSHEDLPETDRDVKTIIYTSVPNKEIVGKSTFKETDSIDITFLNRAIKKYKLIKQFETAIKEISIECVSNNYGDCRVCLPNKVKLFNEYDVSANIEEPDPCLSYTKEEKTKVKKIESNDEIYLLQKRQGFSARILVVCL